MVSDLLMAVASARPLLLSAPLTLYVSMPVWWYKWDRPNRVYDSLYQTGHFVVDVPLVAEFSPRRPLYESYTNVGQLPGLIACKDRRPVREHRRTIFCMTFT
jgi:hypothetical protein